MKEEYYRFHVFEIKKEKKENKESESIIAEGNRQQWIRVCARFDEFLWRTRRREREEEGLALGEFVVISVCIMSRTVLLRVEDTAKQCKTRVQIWARTSNGTFQCFSVLLLPKMAGPEHRSCRQPDAISLSFVFEKPLSRLVIFPLVPHYFSSLLFFSFLFFPPRFVIKSLTHSQPYCIYDLPIYKWISLME